MTQRMLASALFAGFAAGLLAALLHFAFIQPVLLLGEEYESGARVHFAGLAKPDVAEPHSHATAAEETDGHSHDAAAQTGAAADGHDHDHTAADATESPLKRNLLTVLFTSLVYVGYALLLAAGFMVAGLRGYRPGIAHGLLWGLAGFVAVQGTPALGLAPELPGTPAADLTARQIWWLATVLATGAGLAILAARRDLPSWFGAMLLLAAPHIVGAPEPEAFAGVAPPEAAAMFAARALVVGMVAWVALGGLLAFFWQPESA